MAKPNEKLAESLEVLKKLQDKGITAIKTNEISRVHRERLIKNNFIREVVKGWYILVPTDQKDGESTAWYSNYWHFCARYLEERYGKNYCVSAEQSILMHAGNWRVPHQLIIRATTGTNSPTPLPHNTSLFSMRSPLPKAADTMDMEELRVLTLPAALINCSATIFTKNSTDVRAALLQIRTAADILSLLLEGGHSTIAGRLAGAFRNIQQDRIANEILKTMNAVGYNVRETDPFETKTLIKLSPRERSPYVNRIKIMWSEMREIVLKAFPPAPGIPKNVKKYMNEVEELYAADAYHSLSIEKYRVTPELIESVRTGKWVLESETDYRKQKDAMAARGYFESREKVKESILKILNGENAGQVADIDHHDWYVALFAPSITAGIIRASDLAGYRNRPVIISGSMHVPLSVEAVRDTIPTLFELLEQEPEPSVRALLGHFVFVYIHPYLDGNGRIGRFVFNAMLASGGYPWTVVPMEERERYMKSLEKASVEQDIRPFAEFMGWLVAQAMEGKPVAKLKK